MYIKNYNLEFCTVDFMKADGEGLLQYELLLVADAADVTQRVQHLGVVQLSHRKPKGRDLKIIKLNVL